MPDRDDDSAARQPASAQQPQHDENDRQDRTERQEGGRDDAGKTTTSEVSQAGMNPELGDMDAEADSDRDPDQGSGGLPGKMGGGLLGG